VNVNVPMQGFNRSGALALADTFKEDIAVDLGCQVTELGDAFNRLATVLAGAVYAHNQTAKVAMIGMFAEALLARP
jgi:hypothetical protein